MAGVSPFSTRGRHSIWARWGRIGLLLAACCGGSALAQEPAPEMTQEVDPIDDLRRRIEQLEADNRELRSSIRSEAAERLQAIEAAEDQGAMETFAAEPPVEGSFLDATDAAQQQQLSTLEKAIQALSDKASKKTYPSITVNGALQADAGFFHQDAASLEEFGRIKNGADIRRARLSAKGSVTEHTNYLMQVDFGAFGRPTITDMWVEQTDVPLFGNVRIGQWKQPFSLEVVSSYRYTTFMERSLLFVPFTPFRHLGVGFYDHSEDERMTWAASMFAAGQDQLGGSIATGGGIGTAERITYLPHWECDGKEYLHLGAAHYFSAPNDSRVAFRTIPELFIGQNATTAAGGTSGAPVPTGPINGTPFFAQTSTIIASCYNVIGSELLWVEGPFSLQSEGMLNFVDQAGGPLAVLPGGYVQAGYFLTGEHRPYDRKAGAIDRVIPKTNLAFCDTCGNPGIGAWEIAARVSYLNLNHDLIPAYRGGEVTDFTAGINWFWNPYTKIVFNYVHSIANTTPNTYTIANPPNTPAFFGKTSTDMFAMRCQVDF